MAIVRHTAPKYIFLCEPHTASRATTSLLQTTCGGSQLGHHHISMAKLFARDRNHLDPRTRDQYRVLCVVRNPFDVIITRYRQVSGGYTKPVHEAGDDLWEWVKANPKYPGIVTPLHGLWLEADTLMAYETISEDLTTVFGTPLKLPFNEKHVTKGKGDWRDYYRGRHELTAYLWNQFKSFCHRVGYEFTFDSDGVPEMSFNNEVRGKWVRPLAELRT